MATQAKMFAAKGRGAETGAPLPLDDVPALPVRNTLLVMIGVMIASLLQILDTTIANVAIPHMQAALGATPDEISWVLTSYIVASAVAMPITGWLADRIGSKRLLILSTAGFVLASMLCGMAQDITQMVLFRALQGAAGAFIASLSQVAMLDINRPSRQPQMIAIWGMGVMIGPILGPIIGGWLTDNWNWRWVFFVNLPLGIVALAIMIAELPSRQLVKRRFDLFGFSMIAIGISALQLLLDRGNHIDWFESTEAWIYAIAIVSVAWIGTIHFRTMMNQPLFSRAVFANWNLLVAMFFTIAMGMVMFASMALMPSMLQRLFGYSVMGTGWVMMPRGLGTLVSMLMSGFLSRRRIDPRVVVVCGLVLTSLSFWQMAGWSLDVDKSHFVLSGFVQGMGLGLLFVPLNTSAFAMLPEALRTEASSLLNLSRSLGASIGIAITTALLSRSLQSSHSELASHVTSSMSALIDFSAIDRFQQLGTTALTLIDAEVNRQAAMIAYVDNFQLMMWLSLAGLPLALLMRVSGTVRIGRDEPPH